jgi:hypothetical protein
VPPLVGIHGYLPFPWVSQTPVAGEPYRIEQAAFHQALFEAIERAARFKAKDRPFRIEFEK